MTTALVRDTSTFGTTAPVLGQRLRIEASPTFGDLRMNTVSPTCGNMLCPCVPSRLPAGCSTLAATAQAAKTRGCRTLFLGYSTLVRGYDPNSFEVSECTVQLDGSCPEFDRLFGSRLLVFNLEARAPLVGLFKGNLDYGPIPVDLFAFYDGGVAWTRAEGPTDGARKWIASVGAGARVNAFGFLIAELNMARALNRGGRGWFFVFNLRPGF